MNWVAASETVAGLVVLGRLPAGAIEPKELVPPYDKVVRAAARGTTSAVLLSAKFGAETLDAALGAAGRAGKKNLEDWIIVLRRARANETTADKLEQYTKVLRRGEDIDPVEMMGLARRLTSYDEEFITADEIESSTVHMQPTGYKPVDDGAGGIPKSGVLTLAGLPKTGKTRLANKLVAYRAHKLKKGSLVFSYEMPPDEWKAMLLADNPWLTKTDLKRIVVYQGDEDLDVSAWAARALQLSAQYDGFGLIVTDVSEMMLTRGVDEQGITQLGRLQAATARRLAKSYGSCCILSTAQFNDGAYQGGIPRPRHIRYGRMIVAYSVGIWCIYNPSVVWTSPKDEARLPSFPRKAWVINWLQRFGFGEENGDDRDAGAMLIDYTGKKGWGDKLHNYEPVKDIADERPERR